MNRVIKIEQAEYLKDYKIKLLFDDGESSIIDFYDFLNESSNPEIRKYLDKNLFKGFNIVDGDLDWNDFDLVFPIFDLYSGSIYKSKSTSAA